MAITVKNVSLWRKEVENKSGVLAETLEPFAKLGTDLHVVMAYRYPGNESRAAIELYPLTGKKVTATAGKVGLAAPSIPTLLVEGDNKPGLGHVIAQSIAQAGINVSFLVAQVIGRRYSAVIGFESDADAKKSATLIKKATASKRKK